MEQSLLKIQKEYFEEVFYSFYKKVPKPDRCFTIIGSIINDAQKSMNIECDSSEEANKLINYLEIIFSRIKKD